MAPLSTLLLGNPKKANRGARASCALGRRSPRWESRPRRSPQSLPDAPKQTSEEVQKTDLGPPPFSGQNEDRISPSPNQEKSRKRKTTVLCESKFLFNHQSSPIFQQNVTLSPPFPKLVFLINLQNMGDARLGFRSTPFSTCTKPHKTGLRPTGGVCRQTFLRSTL